MARIQISRLKSIERIIWPCGTFMSISVSWKLHCVPGPSVAHFTIFLHRQFLSSKNSFSDKMMSDVFAIDRFRLSHFTDSQHVDCTFLEVQCGILSYSNSSRAHGTIAPSTRDFMCLSSLVFLRHFHFNIDAIRATCVVLHFQQRIKARFWPWTNMWTDFLSSFSL